MNILDFLFPKRCVSCGSFGQYLCPNCLAQIKRIETLVCPVCGRSAIGGATHPGCRSRYSLDGLISVCIYEGPIKSVVKRLKYKPWITDLAGIVVASITGYVTQNTSMNRFIDTKTLVTPVPLHKSRERERGFNQAEILGRDLAKKLNLEFTPDLLIRQKRTKPQADLKGKERLENIKNAFSISLQSPNILRSEYPSILLIDDVWTTGATLQACCDVLKRAGVKKVWALTLAR